MNLLRYILFLICISFPTFAQFGLTAAQRDSLNKLTAADHANMKQQLGIKTLRPGPSGNESAPNHANYDESVANPCPALPDILTLKNGNKVSSAEIWHTQRRPEIIEEFEREVYGRLPKHIPKVTWKVEAIDNEFVGRIPVTAKKLVGHVDNSAYPSIKVDINMMLVTPTNVKGPVPVLMMFGSPSFPSPAQTNIVDFV